MKLMKISILEFIEVMWFQKYQCAYITSSFLKKITKIWMYTQELAAHCADEPVIPIALSLLLLFNSFQMLYELFHVLFSSEPIPCSPSLYLCVKMGDKSI